MNKHTTNPPLKRIRVGRQLKAKLTRAINTKPGGSPRTPDLGALFMSLRGDLGKTPRYKFAKMLEMTELTLQKLETDPLKSGIKPTLKLLEAFGLTIAIEHPGVDQSMGYLPVDQAFAAVRNRNADLTQRDLSIASGVARTTIQNVEAGKAVKVVTLIQLLSVMNAKLAIVSLDEVSLTEVPDLDVDAENEHDDGETEERPLVLDRYAPSLSEMLSREPKPSHSKVA